MIFGRKKCPHCTKRLKLDDLGRCRKCGERPEPRAPAPTPIPAPPPTPAEERSLRMLEALEQGRRPALSPFQDLIRSTGSTYFTVRADDAPPPDWTNATLQELCNALDQQGPDGECYKATRPFVEAFIRAGRREPDSFIYGLGKAPHSPWPTYRGLPVKIRNAPSP